MKIKIVGNGIAALMLAEKLVAENFEVNVLGSGTPQAPRQVMVHLYAGRSFRRSELEIEAFKEAVVYWRSSSFATEVKVNRDINSRLKKSHSQTDNYPWKPPLLKNERFVYGPAFVVDAWGLMKSIREKVEYTNAYIDTKNDMKIGNCDNVVWATGVQNRLPYCTLNAGVSIVIDDEDIPSAIRIGKGVHHASDAKASSIGGAFLNENASTSKSLLLERTRELIPADKHDAFQNTDIFLGKKSVSEDRLPVIGLDETGGFLFTAFGARAFFWLPSSCKLAYELLTGLNFESPYSPLRFMKQKS